MTDEPQVDATSFDGKQERFPCPPWCVADHGSQGRPSDRWHHGVVKELPLIELTPRSGGRPSAEALAAFDISLERPWRGAATYVNFGVGAERDRNFCLTLESTERFIAALGAALLAARE